MFYLSLLAIWYNHCVETQDLDEFNRSPSPWYIGVCIYGRRIRTNIVVYLQVKGMITDFGENMHCQFLEILRSLLDSFTLLGAQVPTLILYFFVRVLYFGRWEIVWTHTT